MPTRRFSPSTAPLCRTRISLHRSYLAPALKVILLHVHKAGSGSTEWRTMTFQNSNFKNDVERKLVAFLSSLVQSILT